MRIATVAMSRGYTASTKMTPMMYQITPFVDFWRSCEQEWEHGRGRRVLSRFRA